MLDVIVNLSVARLSARQLISGVRRNTMLKVTHMKKLLLILFLTLAAITVAVLSTHAYFVHAAKRVLFQEQRKVIMPNAPVAAPKSEDLAVYSAVIEQAYPESRGKSVVIDDRTNDCQPYEKEANWEQNMLGRMSEVGVDTFGDYLLKNRRCASLSESSDLKIKYVIIPDEEVMDVIRNEDAGGWEAFYRKYPNSIGFLTFSRIGFNAEVNQALVYTGRYHGIRKGKGVHVLLSKRDGSWIVTRKYRAWRS